MKTLENHLILFDAECPVCDAVTKAFVKTGLLGDNGRAAYQSEMNSVCPIIDKQRAVNEIALVDLKSGEVTYGVKSLFKIAGNAWPVLRPVFSFEPLIWLMAKIYAFMALNRRVIIPARKSGNTYAYQPTLKIHYRIAYLLFTWICTGFILARYAHLLTGVLPLGGPWREYFICGGQIIFQGMIISTFAPAKFWNYLGNMMTISFGGSLLLLLPLIVSSWVLIPAFYFIVYFMGVAGLMLMEHIRRTKLLELGWTLTITWVLYRLILLIIIIL